jgi:Leucine-rich repeat (LRR) protein
MTKARPRSLQRTGRPGGMFGARRSLHTSQEDENYLTRTASTPTSIQSPDSIPIANIGSTVLHHGEIQTAGGMFRKKCLYFVLTDTHLIRFKTQALAAEMFPSIPSSLGRANGSRHSRVSSMSSSSSLHELHTTTSGEGHQVIPLHQIVAVWRLDDGRPYFSIEIDHFDEDTSYTGSMTLHLNDPRDYELWMSSIRGAVLKARLANPQPFSDSLVEHTCRVLDQERDYDPQHFVMFKVVQRAGKMGPRSSFEDLSKVTSNICILAIGYHKVHLLPLPRPSRSASPILVTEFSGVSYGLMTLTQLNMHDQDDAFSVTFRLPLRQGSTLYLASSVANDIAVSMRHAADYLRPNWAEAPFTWNVPDSLEDHIWPIPDSEEPYECYNRTLAAYCTGYGIDPSRIVYQVREHGEDAPIFELRSPDVRGGNRYTVLELLAIVRSLRYNEYFLTISFNDVNLDYLHNACDRFGDDHVPWTTKSGQPLNILDQESATLLVQEVRALAVKSRRLRRLDFSFCLSRTLQNDGSHQDPGCGICEALFPICGRQWTNIDWIVLNGIHLTEIDIDYIFSAALDKSCHIRALEVSCCALEVQSMQTVLQAITHQLQTIESIDLSGNPARLESGILEDYLAELEFIRKLNLSNINITSGPKALLSSRTLCGWKLVELRLSRTSINEATVDALAGYLISDQSAFLRLLELDRCRLTSREAATLLNAVSLGSGKIRDLHMKLSENLLEQHHDALVDAVSHSSTPRLLTMQMLEYKNENNFSKLLDAFARNATTEFLDISKASLQKDASDETCEALHRMLAKNHTLRELNLCGEHSHLEAANYGSGLNRALMGLMHNESLQVLRIEHQRLGLQGASTLASILEVNHTLQEIHLENNEINLQAFTVIVNAVEDNKTLLFLPPMDFDRAVSQGKVDREVENMRNPSSPISNSVAAMSYTTKATVNRTLGRTIGKTIGGGPRSLSVRNLDKTPSPLHQYSETDIKAAVGSLTQRWNREVARLDKYLARNYNLLHGLPEQDGTAHGEAAGLEGTRVGSSSSLEAALREMNMDEDRTPIADVDRQLVGDFEGEEMDDSGLEMSEHSHV